MMIQPKYTADIRKYEIKFWPFLAWDSDAVSECSLTDDATEEAKEAFEIYKKKVNAQIEYEKKCRAPGFV